MPASHMDRKELFSALLHTLNDSFATWVAEQKASKTGELWIDGAEDYVKHAKELLQEFSDVLEPAAATSKPAANGSTALGAPAAAAPAATSVAPFTFNTSTAPASSAPQSTGAFGNFGTPPASGGAAPAAFGGFSFPPGGAASGALFGGANSGGSFGNAPAGGFGGFGGPAGSPPSLGLAAAGNEAAGGAGTAGGAAGGAEDEDAPKEFVPEVKVDESGSAILFKSRAKVYVQGADKAWKEKGQGLLTVRQPASADGGARAGPSQIVFTTESGRVLVNAALYKGVKVVPQAKKPHMATLALVVAAAESEEAAMRPVLANLYATDSVADFGAAVAKAAPQ